MYGCDVSTVPTWERPRSTRTVARDKRPYRVCRCTHRFIPRAPDRLSRRWIVAPARALRRAHPKTVHVLVALLWLLAVNALFGGASLILDPSGAELGMPVSLLEGSPFRDYLVPGLILFWFLGIVPLMVALALWREPSWGAMAGVEQLLHAYWAWAATVGVGVALIVWIVAQMTILRFFLQPVLLGLGVAIVGVALRPSVRKHYAKRNVSIGQEGSRR